MLTRYMSKAKQTNFDYINLPLLLVCVCFLVCYNCDMKQMIQ